MTRTESVDEWTIRVRWLAHDREEDISDEQVRARAWELARQEDELARLKDAYKQVRNAPRIDVAPSPVLRVLSQAISEAEVIYDAALLNADREQDIVDIALIRSLHIVEGLRELRSAIEQAG